MWSFTSSKITDVVKKVYGDYFGVKLGDQDKQFTPLFWCKTCWENLKDWGNGKRKSMPFVILMIWREGKDYITESHFSMINLKGINRENQHHVPYPEVSSAIKSILKGPDHPDPDPDSNIEYHSDYEHSDMSVVAGA